MLKKLYRLQQLEAAAQALQAERVNSDEYRQLYRLRTVFEADKKKLNQLRVDKAKLKGKIAALTRSGEELGARIAAEKQAMYDGSVTKAKELSARESQLDSLERKLAAVEGEAAELQVLFSKKQEEDARLRQALAEMRSEFSRIRDIYLVRQEERDGRSQRLEEEKAALLAQIDGAELAWYEARQGSFAGTPVACLDRQRICSGCHTMAPQTTYKRAALGQRPLCEKCGRTLFVDD